MGVPPPARRAVQECSSAPCLVSGAPGTASARTRPHQRVRHRRCRGGQPPFAESRSRIRFALAADELHPRFGSKNSPSRQQRHPAAMSVPFVRLQLQGARDHEQRRPSRKRHVPTSEANTRLRIAIRQWCTPTAGTASRNWSPSRRRTSGHINLIVGRRFLIDLLRSPLLSSADPIHSSKAAARELARWIIVFPAAFRRFVSPAAYSWPPPSAQSRRHRRAAAREDRPRR